MKRLLPRMHLFEIDDQPWFPPILRRAVQAALTHAWRLKTPFIQPVPPAQLAGQILIRELGSSLSQYTFVDFCAGAGGPTPYVAREVNTYLASKNEEPATFVLSDIHPNLESWERISRLNPQVTYEPTSVDATRAPPQLVQRGDGKKLMRLFNLAFHHFDDKLAKDILRDTVKTSHGFAIFELQDRSFASFVAVTLLFFVVLGWAPVHSVRTRSPATFFFTWMIPIIPFVLVYDGYISSLRTREPEEVEALLRSCGANTSAWEIKSGRELHVWPVGYLNWVVCRPVGEKSRHAIE
ncbi:unnamed protein product [Clonostachys rosea]|uniref:Methyltransferase domain-containing protein n=1 Tax=Bionectria ochroleuca TaxID=29856 RepID=A0ABY6UTF1_BIOOC|nr:unnamed protein product [Clonostachys rosea]